MSKEDSATRERILNAATDIFSEYGFKAATIREICKLAKTNVAAVNYYFRDKEGLYIAVLEGLLTSALEQYPPDMGLAPGAKPEERLHAFVKSFLYRLLRSRRLSDHLQGGLFTTKELSSPNPALDALIEKHVNPHRKLLFSIIAELLENTASQQTVIRCAISITGQCLHYVYARPIIGHIAGEPFSLDEDIDEQAAHITRFSLGGIQTINEGLS